MSADAAAVFVTVALWLYICICVCIGVCICICIGVCICICIGVWLSLPLCLWGTHCVHSTAQLIVVNNNCCCCCYCGCGCCVKVKLRPNPNVSCGKIFWNVWPIDNEICIAYLCKVQGIFQVKGNSIIDSQAKGLSIVTWIKLSEPLFDFILN